MTEGWLLPEATVNSGDWSAAGGRHIRSVLKQVGELDEKLA
jgi:hypothetical protein